ncbi:MAG: mechanosensitive ion channel family protein [Peptococcaceae bacterium]|jgi:small conductance mechanosensitive channel|nr:mechanosensitive ion channel family protein [Peptococcaceae bacterium]MBQ2020871.1 mechanosensitive ion channel family protein [Peptococcaceae bacterium]MBQ2370106.1 mechanosensitive ion channel family protein [Peptococcaceae bacterium]MBQ5615174.1 mechanosensitive ion channel family protein [Peptococcaceae bacterium]MBQ5668278.1 mechanosensitive ion channel family protein [Peptococcaceae bacterium]
MNEPVVQPEQTVLDGMNLLTNLLLSSVGIFIKICIVLIVMLIAKKVITGFIDNLFHNKLSASMKQNENIPLEEKRLKTLSKLFKSIATYVIYFIAIITCLDMVGFSIMTILAGAGVVSLAVAFGAQSIVEDLMSGIFIVLENQYSVGEFVSIDGILGTVSEIGMKTTKVLTESGELMIIRNGSVGTVINYSRHAQRRFVTVGIAYEENIENAKAVIQHACDIIGERYKDDFDQLPYVQGVTDLADSSVVIRTTFTSWNWTQDPISRALRQEIKEQLDNAGVEISYPKVQIVQ